MWKIILNRENIGLDRSNFYVPINICYQYKEIELTNSIGMNITNALCGFSTRLY